MSADAANLLLQATVASSAAALLVASLRKVLRYALGARVAYWAWLLIPAAAIVVLLPQPEQPLTAVGGMLSNPVRATISGALSAIGKVTGRSQWATALVLIWLSGALLSLALMIRRHRAFVRSLGEMTPQSDGSLRAAACREPMLVGILNPRVVLPPNFDSRYAADEREIVLAHERAHLGRHDPQVNAVAAFCLCLSWFNPLMHWALRLFRFDQELACDASALALSRAAPRRYAEALIKTQSITDLASDPAMMGCHWHSSHPLTERIHMLKRPLPGTLRRRGGFALMLAFVFTGAYAVKAAQSQVAPQPQLIAVNLKVFINGADAVPGGTGAGWDVLISDGGQFFLGDARHSVKCTARSRNVGIVVGCQLLHPNEQVIATPTLVVRDNEQAWVDVTDAEHGTFHLGFNLSTSEPRVAAAVALAKTRAAGTTSFTLTH